MEVESKLHSHYTSHHASCTASANALSVTAALLPPSLPVELKHLQALSFLIGPEHVLLHPHHLYFLSAIRLWAEPICHPASFDTVSLSFSGSCGELPTASSHAISAAQL